MRLWVFSDLHITNSSSSLYLSLLKVLKEPQTREDTVVLAGDIFDLLVGDSSHFRHKYEDFLLALHRLTGLGVNVYYIEGNHDFHLAGLLRPLKVKLEAESVNLIANTQQGVKNILIEHGDLVDESDHRYLQLRKLFRSGGVRALTKLVPGLAIEWIGDRVSRPLYQKAEEIPESWTAEKREALRKTFHDYAREKNRQGFDYLILGHCHDLDQLPPFYWNMGYPPVHRQYLFYDSSCDQMERKFFPV